VRRISALPPEKKAVAVDQLAPEGRMDLRVGGFDERPETRRAPFRSSSSAFLMRDRTKLDGLRRCSADRLFVDGLGFRGKMIGAVEPAVRYG